MHLRRLSVVSASLLAVAAVGCGSTTKDSADSFTGEAKQVATTIDDLQQAGKKRDADKICGEILSTAMSASIAKQSKKSCNAAMKQTLKDVDSSSLKVVKNGIAINGTTATAKVKSKSGTADRIDTIQLVKEGQRAGGKTVQKWKVSALAG